MYSRLREHFSTGALIVSAIALIFALVGGAYAATNSGGGKATASKAKAKVGPRGPKGPKGAQGPAGPAGPQGPAGANGKDGANGANGSNGAAGAQGPTGPTGKNGTNGTPGAPGATGPTGPTGTFGGISLPEGVTETGYWVFKTPGTQTIKDGDGNPVTVGSSQGFAALSFPVMVENTGNISPRIQEADPEFEETCGSGPNGVGGTPATPKAPPKTLCVFRFGGGLENLSLSNAEVCFNPECAAAAINKTGAVLKLTTEAAGPAQGAGSWALTN